MGRIFRRILLVFAILGVLLFVVVQSFKLFHRDTWAAIYLANVSDNGFGQGANAATEAEASDLAKSACEKDGSTPCHKVVAFENACGAVAYTVKDSEGHYFVVSDARDLDAAKGSALGMCLKDYNDGSCKVLVATCSSQATSGGQN